MNSGAWQHTKNGLLCTVLTTRFGIGLVCVIFVLAVSGPFETSNMFTNIQRLAYWTCISISTYSIAHFGAAPVIYWARNTNWNWVVTCLLAGLSATLPVTLFVYTVNTSVLGLYESGINSFTYLLVTCGVISIAGTCIRQLFVGENMSGVDDVPKSQKALCPEEIFLRRIALEKRGDLLSLQAQNHYIEVVTENGKDLILMSLSDATAKLSAIDGMRVHRSWWVARRGIQSISTRNEKTALKLVDGRSVPVSRGNEHSVRAWISS